MTITLCGENTFGLQVALKALVADFLALHDEMGLERIDGEEASFERMQEALQSLPFLASKKLVVLRTPGVNKQFAESAERLLSDVPDSTEVILVEPKLDKRSSYYKFLKKSTDFREFAALDTRGLARWLSDEAKTRSGTLGLGDATLLVERVGNNQQILAHELDKLLLYKPQITRETIELLTEPTPQSTIFQLLEAAFAGQTKTVLKLYDEQRALKVEPQQIIAMLGWQLHIFAIIKAAGERGPDEIARDAKLNPYVVKKSIATVRRLSATELKRLVRDLATLDQRLKRESLDADEVLKHYLLTIAV